MATANKIQFISDHVSRAKNNLLTQYKDSPNINLMVDVLVSEIQELEKALIDIRQAQTLEGAYGKWLDDFAAKFNLNRNNLSDNDFKNTIKIAMAKRTSTASQSDIVRLVSALTNDLNVRIETVYPYMVELRSTLKCLVDSPEALQNVAEMFPLMSRTRLIQQHPITFRLGGTGKGFGSGAKLSNLAYVDDGSSGDVNITSEYPYDLPFVEGSVHIKQLPTIAGIVATNQTVSVSGDNWLGDVPITKSYQWQIDGANIAGATTNSFLIRNSDIGKQLSCLCTGRNTINSVTVSTNKVVVVDGGTVGNPVVLVTPPSISGNTVYGNVLSVVAGTYTGDTPITKSYQWTANNTPIIGATGTTYTTTASDIGKQIRVTETATNAYNSVQTNSSAVTITSVPVPSGNVVMSFPNINSIFSGAIQTRIVQMFFGTNGQVANTNNTVIGGWYDPVTSSVGSGFEIKYDVLSGGGFTNKPAGTYYSLTNAQEFNVTTTSQLYTGSVRFTVRAIATGNTTTKDMTIYIEQDNS